MRTSKEIRLKNLFQANKTIEVEIEKFTNELVPSESFYFSKTPRNYHKVLETLKKFLDKHHSRWVSVIFYDYTPHPADESAVHPHVNISIFLLGKREFILKNIKEISGRIVAGNKWMGKEAGINQQELSIQNFL
jgi:hypothetical protein